MKSILALVFATFYCLSAMSQGYRIVTKDEVYSIFEKEGIGLFDLDGYVKGSNAYIFHLKDGTYLVYLANAMHGILIYQIRALEEMIEKDSFPIEPPDFYTVLPRPIETYVEIEKLRHVNLHIDYFRAIVNEKLHTDYQTLNIEIFREFCLKAHALYRKKQLSPKELLAFMVLAGEFARQHRNGKWAVLKLYFVYNPYYQLYIADNEVKIPLCSRFASFISAPKANLAQLELTLLNPQYLANIKPYINPDKKPSYINPYIYIVLE